MGRKSVVKRQLDAQGEGGYVCEARRGRAAQDAVDLGVAIRISLERDARSAPRSRRVWRNARVMDPLLEIVVTTEDFRRCRCELAADTPDLSLLIQDRLKMV